jgi:hypothetical protein
MGPCGARWEKGEWDTVGRGGRRVNGTMWGEVGEGRMGTCGAVKGRRGSLVRDGVRVRVLLARSTSTKHHGEISSTSTANAEYEYEYEYEYETPWGNREVKWGRGSKWCNFKTNASGFYRMPRNGCITWITVRGIR